jgi:hypothetical protein
MANAYGRSIDGTDLSIDMAEDRGILHRDYITHCLRWSYVAMMMHRGSRYKTTRILDVGCGSDLPLPRLLHSNRLLCEYVGVDYNDASKFYERNWGSMDVTTYGSTIFPRNLSIKKDGTYTVGEGQRRHRLPNLITCFEVLEHVEAKHAVAMIKGFHRMAVKGGAEVVLSTPCWNVKSTAKNHVNEMKHAALGFVLEEAGFEVMHNYGTFASISDYRDALFAKYPGIEPFFNACRDYHDTNVLANMFCSPFPELSRNSIWHLRPAKEGYTRKFAHISHVTSPWASSEDWAELDFSKEKAHE